MANNKLKKFLFPTEEEYVPEVNHNPVFNKTPIVEQQSTVNVKRDMFGQIIQNDYNDLETSSKTSEPLRETAPTSTGTTLVFNPTSYEGAREIAVELTKKNTVVVESLLLISSFNKASRFTITVFFLVSSTAISLALS